MIVTLHLPAETKRKIARDRKLADRAEGAFADSMEAAVAVGAERIREDLSLGALGVKIHRPAAGLAGSVMGWMIDRRAPTGAIGVPANAPAAAYASILERGGTIYPRIAKMLAIPISAEARRYTSPRDMAGLDLIPRKDKPPLLVRKLAARGGRRQQWQIHWVLVPSVTIRPTHWLTKGARRAKDDMVAAFAGIFGQYIRRW